MKSTEFLQENYDMPGISAERLIEVIGRRIELQCPELVTRYGHDVVYDAIEHVAEFHAGTSDVSAMVNQVRRDLESRSKDNDGNIVGKRIDNLKKAVMGLTGKPKQGVSENAEDERLYKKYAKRIGRDAAETARNLVDKSGKFYPNVDRLAALLHRVHNSKKKQGVADESMMAGGMEAFSVESIERKYQELLGETTSAGSVATVMSGGANAGSLFGGSYTNPDNPFAKMAKKTKKTKIIKR